MPQALAGAVYWVGAWVSSGLLAVGVGASAAISFGALVAPALVYATVNMALNGAIKALTPGGKTGETKGLEVSIADSTAEAHVIYGAIRVGGVNQIPPYTSGDDGRYLHQVLAFASHEIYGYGEHYFDNIALPVPGTITGTAADGAITTGKYDDVAWVRGYTGTMSQNVDYILNTAFPTQWPSTSRGRGTSYVAYQFDWKDGKAWQGFAQPTAYVHGAKLYDPRQDTTNGGSGSHRYSDPATWVWASNPALAWANYLIADYGFGLDPATDIDWPSVATAASVCEERVNTANTAGTLTAINTGTNTLNLLYKTGAAGWACTHYGDAKPSASLRWMASSASTVARVGLHTSAADTASPAYSVYTESGYDLSIRESGSVIATFGALSNDVLLALSCRIDYDGTYVRYYFNDQLVRVVAVATPGQSLYAHVSLYYDTSAKGVYMNSERRYTCNGLLVNDAESLRPNEKRLVDCMMGHRRFSNGVWSIHAGAWAAATDTIEKEDWLGIDSIQAFAGRDDGRHNKVHCFYVDPMRNWQRVESYARSSDIYKSDDGGELIEIEHEQPMCTSSHEAQRKAEILLRQSRNGVKLVGLLSPRFQRLMPMDVVALNFAELGWSGKTFRIIQMELREDGAVRVALSEEQAADWTDMAVSEFGATSLSDIPATNPTTPSAIQNFKWSNNTGTVLFKWDRPIVFPRNAEYVIYAGTSVNSKLERWRGLAQEVQIQNQTLGADNPSQLWWARAEVGSYASPYAPSSDGAFIVSAGAFGGMALLRDSDFSNGDLASWNVTALGNVTYNSSYGDRGGAAVLSVGDVNSFNANSYWYIRGQSPLSVGVGVPYPVRAEISYRVNSRITGASGLNNILRVVVGVADLANSWAPCGGINLIGNQAISTPTPGQIVVEVGSLTVVGTGNLVYPTVAIAMVSAPTSGQVALTNFQAYLR